MDITQFNKELGIKIAIATRFERKGDIKAAIQEWIEISEMALNFSKSPKIEISFKNMIINRTKSIFAHIKELKTGQIKEEISRDELKYLEEETTPEISSEMILGENTIKQEEQVNQNSVLNPSINSESETIKNSEFKNIPKGFKEIQPSEDFTIITPHDEDFVKKQRTKAEESARFKPKAQEPSEGATEPANRIDFEQPKDSKSLICFACGYDKNALNDKVCKNCGTTLN